MLTIEEYLKKKNPKNLRIKKAISKVLITLILFLSTLIMLKSNTSYKQKFYEMVFDNHLSFAKINETYQKYFGYPLPFIKQEVKTVFEEKLSYQEINTYKDGAELKVGPNYLVPTLETGIVIYVGEKEGYNKTIIVQTASGLETWYGNVQNENVKMYDYIEKGKLLGEVNEKLYMVFMKNGEILEYENYI